MQRDMLQPLHDAQSTRLLLSVFTLRYLRLRRRHSARTHSLPMRRQIFESEAAKSPSDSRTKFEDAPAMACRLQQLLVCDRKTGSLS